MTISKQVFTERVDSPFVAPNTLAIYARGDRLLYIKDELQQIRYILTAVTDVSLEDIQTDIEDIQTDVDGIQTETEKIDNAATDGLTGVSNSLSYRVHEIERHLHSGARWFGAAVTPDGEVHVADRLGPSVGAFQIDGGNNAWGSWVQVLGSDDTPTVEGKTHFDPHLLVISDNEKAGVHFIQFARGDSGAAGYAAGNYTELALDLTSKAGGTIIPVQTGRAPAASKLWARCLLPGVDTGTIDFYMGIHEYEG